MSIGSIGVNLGGTGTPIDIFLEPLSISILRLPTISIDLTLNPIEIKPLDITLHPLEIKLDPIEIKPLEISLRLTEIPSVRVHLPVDYKVGLSLLGHEVFCVHLCGQGQVITEPYIANPCEC